jgi:hypothetical protein
MGCHRSAFVKSSARGARWLSIFAAGAFLVPLKGRTEGPAEAGLGRSFRLWNTALKAAAKFDMNVWICDEEPMRYHTKLDSFNNL